MEFLVQKYGNESKLYKKFMVEMRRFWLILLDHFGTNKALSFHKYFCYEDSINNRLWKCNKVKTERGFENLHSLFLNPALPNKN